MAAEAPVWTTQPQAQGGYAVTGQPTAAQYGVTGGFPVNMMAAPVGLEFLNQVSEITAEQEISLTEIMTGCDVRNKFKIMANNNQQLFFAEEFSECCERICCGQFRSFEMKITNNGGFEVMRLQRPLKCQGCPCAVQELAIEAPVGNHIGLMREVFTCFGINYEILNAAGDVVFKLTGPYWETTCCPTCCNDISFPIFMSDGVTQVGSITKLYKGCGKEMWSNANTFHVQYLNPTMDVTSKSILMAALFLININFFERKNQN